MPINKVQGKKYGKQKYRVRVNYTDDYGKPKQLERTAYGLDEAKALEIELLNGLKNDKAAVQHMTVEQLYEEYINNKKYEVRESSLDKNIRVLKRYVLNTLNKTELNKLTPPVLQEWKHSLESLEFVIQTKKNIYSNFHAMLNYAVKMDYLSKNPLDKVGNFKMPSAIETKQQMDYYTGDEFKKFIAEAKAVAEQKDTLQDWGYYVFFNIAFFTGMRKGEIGALRWRDIKDNTIYITRSLNQKLKGEDRITPPKNNSSIRNIQMPKPLINALKEHRERYKAVEGFNDDFLICGGLRALRDTSVQQANIKFAKLANQKSIRIHDFRHSHASLLANEGINIQEIARRLGHSKISMTWETYSHLYPQEEERALKVLDSI